jgi:hypothetical protein
MSSTYGAWPSAGIATAIGFVPCVFCRPNVGTARCVEFVIDSPMSPCLSAIIA